MYDYYAGIVLPTFKGKMIPTFFILIGVINQVKSSLVWARNECSLVWIESHLRLYTILVKYTFDRKAETGGCSVRKHLKPQLVSIELLIVCEKCETTASSILCSLWINYLDSQFVSKGTLNGFSLSYYVFGNELITVSNIQC